MREHRFALLTAGATWVLLILGALVHPTGSSLACPDWPLCYGTLFPEMRGGVEYEHTHRLAASTVGLLTIALAVLLRGRRPVDRSLRALGLLAVVLVCVQGLLGGITVLYRLPTLVSVSHLGLSMIFFSLLVVLVARTAPRAAPLPAARTASLAPLRPWVAAAALLVLVQIVIGGFVRHTGARLACLDVPLCYQPVGTSQQVAVHVTHRVVAVAVGALVCFVGVRLARRAGAASAVGRLGLSAVVLVLVQITLGILSVTSLLDLGIITAHLGVAALLLGALVFAWASLPGRSEPAPSAADGAEPAVAA